VTFVGIKFLCKVGRKIVKNIKVNNDKILVVYLITFIYILIFKYLGDNYFNYIFILVNIFGNILMKVKIRNQLIFGGVVFSGILSEFNILHVIFNLCVLYIVMGFDLDMGEISKFVMDLIYGNNNNNNNNKNVGFDDEVFDNIRDIFVEGEKSVYVVGKRGDFSESDIINNFF
jgi:hypothetical protein